MSEIFSQFAALSESLILKGDAITVYHVLSVISTKNLSLAGASLVVLQRLISFIKIQLTSHTQSGTTKNDSIINQRLSASENLLGKAADAFFEKIAKVMEMQIDQCTKNESTFSKNILSQSKILHDVLVSALPAPFHRKIFAYAEICINNAVTKLRFNTGEHAAEYQKLQADLAKYGFTIGK